MSPDFPVTMRLPRSTSLNFESLLPSYNVNVSKSFSAAQVSYGRSRRRSLNEKLMADRQQQNRTFCLCFSLRFIILALSFFVFLYELYIKQIYGFMIQQSEGHSFQSSAVHHTIAKRESVYVSNIYPSLNVLDYWDYSYPVFPNIFPHGISRTDMPQLNSAKSSDLWQTFENKINEHGGKISLHRNFDLRLAKPLQSQISGNIVYNVVLEVLKAEVSAEFFKSRIVLVKSKRSEISKDGTVFPAGTIFILDGHHTTFASLLCAVPQTKLRLGYLYQGSDLCGKSFSAKQDLFVIEGLGLLEVRNIAITSGAGTGQGLTFEANSSLVLI